MFGTVQWGNAATSVHEKAAADDDYGKTQIVTG
jgi:hypothetical protein